MAMERAKMYVDPTTGKVVKDGRTMSKSTYFKIYGDLFKSSAEKLKETKKISSTPVAKKAATKKEAKQEAKVSKKAAKTLKKVSGQSSTSASVAAREAAAKRARLVAPSKRTPAQKLAIANQTKFKNAPTKQETKAFKQETKRIAKAKATVRSGRSGGFGRGRGGGAGGAFLENLK